MQKLYRTLTFLVLFPICLITVDSAFAQWSLNPARQLEIPDITAIESSETHLYALSETEGLVVFRAHSDSLQWLYSSTGMQQRGNTLQSDIRFAYLYGNGRRLTVVEPTSVLGVYSSTLLPSAPNSVSRIGNKLYLALGENGLGTLDLSNPESVDSEIMILDQDRFRGQPVQSLVSDNEQILYVLSGGNRIDIYRVSRDRTDSENPPTAVHDERVRLDRAAEKLFLTENELVGSDSEGRVFLINSDGRTNVIADAGTSIKKLSSWNDTIVFQTSGHVLWLGDYDQNSRISAWRLNEQAGNHFTVTENELWVSNFDNIAPVTMQISDDDSTVLRDNGPLKIADIEDIILPFPKPLLLPLTLENSVETDVSFSYEAPFTNARIRGNTFYWQPTATQTGRHRIEIFATTPEGENHSVSFMVELRPFNSPPRFTPLRPITIPINEAFQLEIKAVDPDGMNKDLIRYLAVDLPDGARLDERTGQFTWNPSIRQVGTHRFEIVATDQYGAAASQDVEIQVLEISEDESDLENGR
ncbi:Ig domain-containing protein [Rhodohalobacter mucosus]|uniref:Uncharacterized protein n=1 Tax=Rhodohalobacter mucosus TaxID=2079485 RepID=A0A316TNJ8_9BACT|nr:Ig domain-containing protein [Rhodohalobacter mucosus]PWN06167.1 hypothetical protein DDZ15_10000 [Rhodohalobacter mucosus]